MHVVLQALLYVIAEEAIVLIYILMIYFFIIYKIYNISPHNESCVTSSLRSWNKHTQTII